MEEVSSSSLFSLTIDPATKSHLFETARWARFLAIVGMVALGLLILFGVLYSIWAGTLLDTMQDRYGFQSSRGYSTGVAVGSAFMFIVMAVIAFFPLLYMLRFSNQMRTALYNNNQESLNVSFQNLKRYFRYLGIIVIIYLGLSLLWIAVFGLAFLATR